uniref:Uncharacterized protein n=1 Tax=Panagrellus redivivus TaxID=6233 RepID=A0A7E4V0D9_PANRE
MLAPYGDGNVSKTYLPRHPDTLHKALFSFLVSCFLKHQRLPSPARRHVACAFRSSLTTCDKDVVNAIRTSPPARAAD